LVAHILSDAYLGWRGEDTIGFYKEESLVEIGYIREQIEALTKQKLMAHILY